MCVAIRNSADGWEAGTRIDVLSSLSDEGPPTDDWQRLIWLSRVSMYIEEVY